MMAGCCKRCFHFLAERRSESVLPPAGEPPPVGDAAPAVWRLPSNTARRASFLIKDEILCNNCGSARSLPVTYSISVSCAMSSTEPTALDNAATSASIFFWSRLPIFWVCMVEHRIPTARGGNGRKGAATAASKQTTAAMKSNICHGSRYRFRCFCIVCCLLVLFCCGLCFFVFGFVFVFHVWTRLL